MRLEAFPPLDERQAAHVLVSVAEQIEEDERHRLCMIDARHVGALFEMDPALKALEPRGTTPIVERDDLAVEGQRQSQVHRRRFERPHDRRELRCFLVAEAGPYPN